MRAGRIIVFLAAAALAAVPATTASAKNTDLGHQTLPADDGWAADGAGTTGGAAATADHVYTVGDRNQLVAAFADAGDAPKIIYVSGTIDADVDASGNPLSCDDYAAGTGYTLDGYLAAYDPATWGRTEVPSGPMEDARVAAEKAQAARVELKVPSNTTIVGVGRNAGIVGGDLDLDGVDNVIVRNLTLANAYDCFPQWDPTDGDTGNWNSQFDLVTIIHGTTHVWLDHNTLTDRPYLDSAEPTYFDRPYQQHDGASDITDASDFVTVSWNVYADHDKTMLIGSTDSDKYDDADHLRVTVHHNEFVDVGQRVPRLRWGHTDVYDNYYVQPAGADYGYSYAWGVGVSSHIYAQNNYVSLAGGSAADVVHGWGGTEIHTAGTIVNGKPVDVRAAYNAVNDPDLADDTSWTPPLRTGLDPAAKVPSLVGHCAGAGHLS